MTDSWVYLFSKFTPEALLFEALGIFVLSGVYAGYWLVKKRRIGAAGEQPVPAGVVKTYLNELIFDAEQMRAQLFGLLRSAGVDLGDTRLVAAAGAAAPGATTIVAPGATVTAADPSLLAKLQALEARMGEQAKALEAVVAEKERLLAELAAARAAAANAGAKPDTSKSDAEMAELLAKLQNLEAKLAEYSIIEDDLANLKRLQQENAQLRGALGAGGQSVPTAATTAAAAGAAPTAPAEAATAAAPAPAAAAKAPEAAPAPADTMSASVEDLAAALASEPAASPAEPAAAAAAPAAAEPAAAAPAPAATVAPDSFESLVDQVEKSLQPEPGSAPAPSDAAASPDAAAAPAAAMGSEKSDADLVEEFEKMLNG